VGGRREKGVIGEENWRGWSKRKKCGKKKIKKKIRNNVKITYFCSNTS
jgi:hypothetical protein